MSKQEYVYFGEDVSDDVVLRDVTAYKAYLIVRRLEAGDVTFDGSLADASGLEFIDDVGDTVAVRLTDLEEYGTAFSITNSPDVADRDGAEAGDTIVIDSVGLNRAFRDTTLGKAYIIKDVIEPGQENSYYGVEEAHSKIEFIDDVGDVVSYIPGFGDAKHTIIKASA